MGYTIQQYGDHSGSATFGVIYNGRRVALFFSEQDALSYIARRAA